MELDEKTVEKRRTAAIKLGLDIEPYETYLGPDFVFSYIETLVAVQRQLTRKLNRIAKHILEVQLIDFEQLENTELNRILEEEHDDDAD